MKQINGAGEPKPGHEDSDEDDVADAPLPAEKGRVQNAVFSNWLSRRAEQSTLKDLESSMPRKADEALSIHDLMAKHESHAIIRDPREYQLELFEKAKKQNIIAVLDTGSGKTLIAVLLLKHILDQEIEDRAKGKLPRVAFFLTDKVALCYQQFAVLEANLDQPVEKLCGDATIDSFSRAEWERLLKENKVIVCTAAVLNNVLHKAYVSIAQINLLIFDEAHHTKKNHQYAMIVKEFYVHTLPDERPRIFGMTASPIDAKEDVEEATTRLETLLHCQIATTSDLSLLQYSLSRPIEMRLSYGRLQKPYLTKLGFEMESRYGGISIFEKIFRNAREAASELGEWCADHLWALAFSEEEASKFENKTEQDFNREYRTKDVKILDEDIKQIREARRYVERYTFTAPQLQVNSVSEKALALNQFLFDLYLHAPQSRTLVFVQQRYTAWLLADVIRRIGSPHISLAILLGAGSGQPGEPTSSIRQQMVTIHKFRSGNFNLLISTSVAEEGLDIPDCNCVIRFDLYSTMIEYIQSRGRARHKTSKFVSMVESDNPDHEKVLQDVRLGEMKMRQFCNALPEDRLLKGNDYDLDRILSKDKVLPVYKDPETGAKLTFDSSLMTLDYFVTSLPREDENIPNPNYVMNFDGKGFLCEVLLPAQAPIRSAMGRPYGKKALAKRSAAFEMCLLLRRGQYLDKNLMPIYHKQLPAMRNAQLALNVKATNSYKMRLKPGLWEQGRGTIPKELYVTVICLEDMTVLSQDCAPLALLTRSPLIQFPEFPVFPNSEGHTKVISRPIKEAIRLTEDILTQLNSFTLQMFYDLFNKKFENNFANMSYWLAPVPRAATEIIKSPDPLTGAAQRLIDWKALRFVYENEVICWYKGMPPSEVEGKFLVDKWDGGRRFFAQKIIPYMRPQDAVPENCAPARNNASILDYSISLFSKSRAKAEGTWVNPQPVLRTQRVLHRRNWLDEWTAADKEARTLAYLCPEPLRISAIPAATVAMCYVFPAIIHRFEEYLVVVEAAARLQLDLRLELALEALTKDSDNTEEHRMEQVQFQRGMGKNYERLEFLGDTFLKMATSISLYAQNAGDDEFESHVKRMLMICNKNLFNHAVQCQLYEFVRTQAFSRRMWYPEGLKLLEGKGKNMAWGVVKHRLNDKSIADVCEALIGAALLSPRDPLDMDTAVRAVTVMVQSPDHAVNAFANYAKLYTAPEWQKAPATAAQLDLVDQLASLDGYRFRSPRLLRSAFTHPSHPFSRERVPSYQRLEFLGDALLDMACVRLLFEQHPTRDPQWLTEHKMAMVSNQFLGALCVHLGLHRHLKHSHPALLGPITEYAAAFSDAAATAKDGQMDYWLQPRSPPKCLADIVEAYIGALFVDTGFMYAPVAAFVHKHVAPFFADMSLYDDFANAHPGAALQRLLATPPLRCGRARVLAAPLPTVAAGRIENRSVFAAATMVHDVIVTTAEAASARQAKARAAGRAVAALQGMEYEEFVGRFACDCRPEDVVQQGGELGDEELLDRNRIWEASTQSSVPVSSVLSSMNGGSRR